MGRMFFMTAQTESEEETVSFPDNFWESRIMSPASGRDKMDDKFDYQPAAVNLS